MVLKEDPPETVLFLSISHVVDDCIHKDTYSNIVTSLNHVDNLLLGKFLRVHFIFEVSIVLT